MKIVYTFNGPEFDQYHTQFFTAARFWELFIKDDRTLQVTVAASPSDGQGGLKASAAWNSLDGSDLPITAAIGVDIADVSKAFHFTETLIHELGHALGVGTLWKKRKLYTEVNRKKVVFTGTNAVQALHSMPGWAGKELLVVRIKIYNFYL